MSPSFELDSDSLHYTCVLGIYQHKNHSVQDVHHTNMYEHAVHFQNTRVSQEIVFDQLGY